MRSVDVSDITQAVARLCKEANYHYPEDIYQALVAGETQEAAPLGKSILGQLIKNADIAKNESIAICQDTGMAVFFIEIGQDVHIVGGSLEEAVNKGVAIGYTEGYLRKSVVSDPVFERKNTTDNTPAILHISLVSGDKMKITICPKGFGSENKSGIKMLVPADGVEGIKKAVIDFVKAAGGNPCPPIVVGVGIGGTMEKAAILSKKALIRPINEHNAHPNYAKLEEELLQLINSTGIGPQGLGGSVTCIGVNIEWYPTHIAGMPVAVNICCHATRHAIAEL